MPFSTMMGLDMDVVSKTFINKMMDLLLHLSNQLRISIFERQTVRLFKTFRQFSQ